MKDFTIRFVLTLVLTFLPIIPLFYIEPIHEGVDMNIYSFWGELYIRIFMYFMGICWYNIAKRIINKFLGEDKII